MGKKNTFLFLSEYPFTRICFRFLFSPIPSPVLAFLFFDDNNVKILGTYVLLRGKGLMLRRD